MKTETVTLNPDENVFTRLWPVPGAHDVVLCLHGVESHSEWFDELGAQLQRQGLACFAYDRSGWGQSPGSRGHLDSYDDALGQLEKIATRLRAQYDRVHLAGLSWGGMLAMYAALRRGILFESVTLIAPGILPQIDLHLLQKLRVAKSVLSSSKHELVPLALKVDHFTARKDKAEYIQNDPHRTRNVSASFCFESLKMRTFIKQNIGRRGIPPTQVLLAGRDAMIDNYATESLLAQANATIRHYPGAAHSLVFEDPSGVARDIAEMVQSSKIQPTGKHVVVMGAGAVGSAVGGVLALAGNSVTLVGRQAHVDAVNTDGLKIKLGHGTRTVKSHLIAVTNPAAISAQADLIIFAVKSFDTDAALQQVKPLVGYNTILMSLQNGIGNDKRIAETFPHQTILCGAICAYLDFAAPGEIHWTTDRGGVMGGVVQGDGPVAAAVWRTIFSRAMIETGLHSKNPAGVKWSKLMLNVAFNALNAVTGLPTAEILAHPEYGMLAVRALKEGFAVMRGMGIAPVDLPGYPVRKMARLCRLPAGCVRPVLAKITARETKTVSSMAQDFRRKRGLTEIDEINGAVAEAGKSCGVATPANDQLCRMVEESNRSVLNAASKSAAASADRVNEKS